MWKNRPFSKGQAWIDLLLSANHDGKKVLIDGALKTIERGQIHTSILKLGEKWGWNRKTVTAFLELLKTDEMVTINSTTRGTTITIINYEFFQGDGATKDTTKETPKRTTMGQVTGQLRDNSLDTNNNVRRINKNSKNVKEEKKGVTNVPSEQGLPEQPEQPQDDDSEYGYELPPEWRSST